MSETEINTNMDIESNKPSTANVVYRQLFLALFMTIVFEGIAIFTGDVLSSLVGQVLLMYVYNSLFQKRYRVAGLVIYFATWLAFFLLLYFGCPSLPAPFCRATAGIDWLNRLSEGIHFTILSLALVLVAFTIKSRVSVENERDV